MKEANYLSHDFGARNDPKLLKLQMKMGGQGLGIWWCLVEMIWEADGRLPMDYDSLAFGLRWATAEDVKKVVEDFDLFENDGEMFWSNSALARMSKRNNISESRRAAGRASGESRRQFVQQDANTSTTQSEQEGTNTEQVLNKCSTNAEQVLNNIYINKDIYRDIDKNIDSSSCARAEEQKQVFEIFFFELDFVRPAYELKRFWNYYEGNGWTWKEGKPVCSIPAVARQWTPENREPHLPVEFREWYRRVYDYAERHPDLEVKLSDLLTKVDKAEVNGKELKVRTTTRAMAEKIAQIVEAGNLSAGYEVKYFYNRK